MLQIGLEMRLDRPDNPAGHPNHRRLRRHRFTTTEPAPTRAPSPSRSAPGCTRSTRPSPPDAKSDGACRGQRRPAQHHPLVEQTVIPNLGRLPNHDAHPVVITRAYPPARQGESRSQSGNPRCETNRAGVTCPRPYNACAKRVSTTNAPPGRQHNSTADRAAGSRASAVRTSSDAHSITPGQVSSHRSLRCPAELYLERALAGDAVTLSPEKSICRQDATFGTPHIAKA